MRPANPPYKALKKPVATWLREVDYQRLIKAAGRANQTLATYIRSVIIDALADEDETSLSVSATVPCPPEQNCRT